MRLEKIKLAGFKSFVDPTTVLLPSNLVGVVGPNGCGKSNVIDAVRWVMGESSAKMLRGESMADVIFNGSTGRKPVGLASIELVFDNSSGRAGGEYARFNQISVKRQVSRDGLSAYFLNGSRCRRRDIQDLFLGTGLGPRSYAIIEQGMISRIIEARPEDLRLFLEEAAGISKYKERRKETESRMKATRENLERMDDLREEVGKQLLHLERQADTAARYTALKAEERQLELGLKALRWRALDAEIGEQDRKLAALANDQEAGNARLRRIEADIEARRADHAQASDAFNQVQGRFYAVGSEIARAEQAIGFANERRGRSEAELVRLDQELAESAHHLERDAARLTELESRLADDEPRLAEAEAALGESVSVTATAEDQLRAWEAEWDRFNREANAPASEAQVQRARINYLEQRLGRDQDRLRRIDEELGRLDPAAADERVEGLEAREHGIEARQEAAEAERDGAAGALGRLESESRELAGALDGLRTELQQAKGRRASLAALQDAALGEDDAARQGWLAERGLANARRLADHLKVAPGLETAAEVLLDDALRALPVDDLDGLVRQGVEPGLVLLDTRAPLPAMSPGASSADSPVPDSLAARVESPWPLDGLLPRARVAADLADALDRRASLAPDECLVTPDGTRVGPHWLKSPPANGADGVLARGEALETLDAEIETLNEREAAHRERAEALDAELGAARHARDAADASLTALGRELSQVRAELGAARARAEQLAERRAALDGERAELVEQGEEALEEMETARERLHELLEAVDAASERREALESQREGLRDAVARARDAERNARARVQDLRVAVESNRAARDATRRSLERAEEQRELQGERRDSLVADLEEAVEPLAELRERLDAQLVLRVEVESELADARARMESLDAEVRELEQERHRVEQSGRGAQDSLDALRLERQERLVRRTTLEEQLSELGVSAAAVLAELPAEAEEEAWTQRLSQVGARIQRLGAINLAAIDEFEEQKQRKVYLDEQHADISRALETLESAIRKIDRETRGRFKETFDQVHHGFQQLFPKLFGGGHAYLELTGEDLLETGVSVMARPPGKRNSSIHLLSGGEKALTAVALVFAIFQLNPAPFCMLDEVDAPLDDANVGRYSELVRSMSDSVQFIFISHNKVTMEIAQHLVGVTMHEPGVSRLVSVDMEEAVRLAAV